MIRILSKFVTVLTLSSLITVLTVSIVQAKAPTYNGNITEEEILATQKGWGAALIEISKVYKEKGIEQAKTVASDVLDSAYGYNMGTVLFKPTLTVAPQTFRVTKDSALAYFVGGNKDYPDDSGFALKGWTKYEFENAAVYIQGDMALTMGKVRLTNDKGEVTEVDKTWAFRKDNAGKLRIVLHHSSLPYTKK